MLNMYAGLNFGVVGVDLDTVPVHVSMKLKLVRILKSETMIVPKNGIQGGTGVGLKQINVADHLNTVPVGGGSEIHVLVKDGSDVIAHCKVFGNEVTALGGWAGREFDLCRMIQGAL